MTRISPETPQDLETRPRCLSDFARNEDGVVTIFSVFIMLMMLMVAGIGVDLMQNEMRRTALQNTVDRAVLAAADLDQTRPPAEVVEDYFDKTGLREYLTAVNPDQGLNYRTVTAQAFMRTNTQFMALLGVDSLPVPAFSQAIEDVPNVEISLVLDISGSMRFSDRMDNLRPAAKDFIDIVLLGPAANTTSINLIPYAGQTNPGPFMFNRLGGVRYEAQALDENEGGVNELFNNTQLAEDEDAGTGSDPDARYVYPNLSSCIDFDLTSSSDFLHDRLPSQGVYQQTAHFMNWKIATEIVRDADGDPVMFDENGEPLEEGQPGGTTRSVMDWGWCPQDQTSIIYASNNAAQLKQRIDTMRMHDGTGTHYAMKWALALLNPDSQPDFAEMAKPANGLVPPQFADRPLPFNDIETVKYIVLMTDGQITEQVRPKDTMHEENPTRELNARKSDREQMTSQSSNVTNFKKQCDLAKETSRNVVIYTIAFEAPGTPEDQMRYCASSDSHFFRASGKEQIAAAFSTIARQINELRLTQ
ncbi:TadE/TadG family type IV pilus assembly protein [Roseobacter sinensis]|uniref:Pilus assembly protein TadG-related protein n=1 Tax=Roseobacter sinensis TaxID=2931391 RepID=A0ABT3BHE8_9RHOB|nr:TadE/TadG family type IV pilus assembly protein [Roseobacter sp. WL0113]MCV3272603.1 pilus assembly protein TadG-related protein [Roseobacter sp. WL0113]